MANFDIDFFVFRHRFQIVTKKILKFERDKKFCRKILNNAQAKV
jgi:hypothetical protein